MDFIKQLVCFHRKGAGNLTPNAIAIYMYLFMVDNERGWEEWFEVSDYWIGTAVGIKRRETIVAALNILKQRGFIDFERGTKRNQATKYKIIALLNSAKDSAKDSAKTENPLINNKNINININKNNIGARAKFIPPTLDEINKYVIEKNLHVSAKEFLDYFTEMGWVDSKGQTVKNWKGKILTWEKFQPKQKENSNTQDDIDRAIAFFDSREGGTA